MSFPRLLHTGQEWKQKNLLFILIDQKGTETPLKGSTVAFDGRPGSSSNSSNNA